MMSQVADGVRVHQSPLIESNTVVVNGAAGVLVVDPGLTVDELADLAGDIRASGDTVAAGFSTHPDWDHVLWHPELGDVPRYGTARGAAAMQELLSNADWRDQVAGVLPAEIADDVPMDLLGILTPLPAGAVRLPWDGPAIRVIEHQAHAAGHAALLIEESRVLVAGDMLSDVLVPMLDLQAVDPIGDYLAALDLLEAAAGDADVVVPGHGSVGDADELRARIAQDRAYVLALRDGTDPADPRTGASAKPGWEWVAGVHAWQVQSLSERSS
jgi:glyoxylase-like metal-dependent hydrolase (beta-lactamase superfamily II)